MLNISADINFSDELITNISAYSAFNKEKREINLLTHLGIKDILHVRYLAEKEFIF